ncbi:DUF2628 domain-containing protein [Cetobacterium sp. 8H]|uniref:DUF2628 domain-containing protein n=1 Tax=Cetobacterium sp. 8H TaxID=2759681 RepID=UPI00163B8DA8|nr:DUF2628 domain-containing protein [Cetobacterium sp. 8H]MBC2851796.1 DUF2628 domain-containing protein [Cetobacterium sp. 8H]
MESRIEFVEKHFGSLEDFVRKNPNYYLENWQSGKIKFNFAAFLFEAYWFAYRKMYFIASLLIGINFFINILTIYILVNTKFLGIGATLLLCIRIYIGFKANEIYFNRAKKILEKTNYDPTDEECGTSLLGVVIAVFTFFLIQTLIDLYLHRVLNI